MILILSISLCFLWTAHSMTMSIIALVLNMAMLTGFIVDFSLRVRERTKCPVYGCTTCHNEYDAGWEVLLFIFLLLLTVCSDIYLLFDTLEHDIWGVLLALIVDQIFVVKWAFGHHDRAAARGSATTVRQAEMIHDSGRAV